MALDALLMAIWRRRPTEPVLIHSDQGVQYGSDDWQRICRDHGLEVDYPQYREHPGASC